MKNDNTTNDFKWIECFNSLCQICNGATDIPFRVIESSMQGVNLKELADNEQLSYPAKDMITKYINRFNPNGKKRKEWFEILKSVSNNGRRPVFAHTKTNICGNTRSIIFSIGRTDTQKINSTYPGMLVIKCKTINRFKQYCDGVDKDVNIEELYSFE